MMVDVEEGEGLLLEDKEHGVTELPVLEKVVEDVEGLHARSPGILSADGVEEAVVPPDRDDLLEHAGEEEEGGGGEEQVVQDKGLAEGEGGHIVAQHPLSDDENDGQVGGAGHEDSGGGGEGRAGGLPREQGAGAIEESGAD